MRKCGISQRKKNEKNLRVAPAFPANQIGCLVSFLSQEEKIFADRKMTNGSKPSALILGGCGFIGRNVVQFLVEQQLCSRIRVADKVLPATAYLTARQQKAFDQVEFKQANLVSPASIERAFQQDDSKSSWDWVINLAAVSRRLAL